MLFISKSYKKSAVCLNELGAAWYALEKEKVIPVILPDCDFDSLGFLDQGRLGTQLINHDTVLTLIDDIARITSTSISVSLLNKHVNNFTSKIKHVKKVEVVEEKKPVEQSKPLSDNERCFQKSLYPFSQAFSKTLPHLNNGLHYLVDQNAINTLFKNISEHKYPNSLWYTFSGGDMHFSNIQTTKQGHIKLDGWELNITEAWVNRDSLLQNEFILIKTEPLPPYKIQTDVGGESYCVGVQEDGFIISETERGNGYALINGESVKLDYDKIEPQYRNHKPHWILISTDYHKTRVNVDETEAFCETIDEKENIKEEELRKFIRSLQRNHPVVSQNS